MTIRNLDACFRPKSVAIVGASSRPGSVGAIVLDKVVASGFSGPILPINPKYDRLGDLPCFQSARQLPVAPDLAVIATPPHTVPGVIGDLAAAGCKAAVVITAGIGVGNGLRQAMLEAARPHLMRIVGPNTIGTISPWVSLDASFAPASAAAGGIALVSQSGAMIASIIDWAAAEGVGFSQLVSLGDMADVDVGDCLNWLAQDPRTKSILLYLESIPAARKFMSAARAAARIKPVIALKPGRHDQSAKAAMTHTGSLAGSDTVVEAALRRAGIIRVESVEELFDAAEVTARFKALPRGRVGLVTNGGGAGVLAVDDLLDRGCELAQLSSSTINELDQVLPPTWSKTNPVDIIGDATPERYRDTLSRVSLDPGVDVVLAMNCPTALASPLEAAKAIATDTVEGLLNGKPLIGCWLGKETAEPARQVLRKVGIVTSDTPAASARAVALLTDWSRLKTRLERVPESAGEVSINHQLVRDVLRRATEENRRILTEPEAKSVLAACGIGSPEPIVAYDLKGVEAAAAGLLASHESVVVKLYSKSITHKSDLGGVVLNLTSPSAAREAAEVIKAKVDDVHPGGLDGFVVQPMVRRPKAHELLLGLSNDPGFGPVVLFGAGGTAVEVIRDTATGLVPLDEVLAGDLIDGTRIGRLLAGYRDRPPIDRVALIKAILALSQLAIDHPAIVAADINPLLADDRGVVALDARIEIDPSRLLAPTPNPYLSIRPYPSGWSQHVALDRKRFLVRPIKPADAALYPEFLAQVSAEDMRLRFLVPTSTLSHETLIRLSQLDYDRHIAFIAIDDEDGSLAGVVRYSADPDHHSAEFGLLVRSDLQGIGLGTSLLSRLIEYATSDGLKELVGNILLENATMMDLVRRFGFEVSSPAKLDGTLKASLSLI